MSSSVCHAPLPARMEAFTTRLCLRAVDQYEKLLHTRFNKSFTKEPTAPTRFQNHDSNIHHINQNHLSKHNNNYNNSKEHQKRQKDGVAMGSYVGFRQWRKNTSTGKNNRSSSAGPTTNNVDPIIKLPTDSVTIQKLDQFPFLLSDTTMPNEDLSLKFLALNALDLTAPASDVLLKSRLKSWFQLSGHPDGFAPAGPGTVWKRKTGGLENTERIAYEQLGKDEAMKDCIPRYYREVEYQGDSFMELQDLLFGFNDPHVMDIKMGTRTFLESEVSKTTARPDLYQKMILVDPNAPTQQEHEQRAVTKLRYMQFREEQSSTCSHGFRIEAMKFPGAPPITDLKKVKSHEEVLKTMRLFFNKNENTRDKMLERLKILRSKIESSSYFKSHEVIGSSIFMIYSEEKVGVWVIDFAKTCRVENGRQLTHRDAWESGNHEEGFLFGLDNLICTIEELNTVI